MKDAPTPPRTRPARRRFSVSPARSGRAWFTAVFSCRERAPSSTRSSGCASSASRWERPPRPSAPSWPSTWAAWPWGRDLRAGRRPEPVPLRLYAVLEIAIGLYALLLPFLFAWASPLYVATARGVPDSPALLVALRAVSGPRSCSPDAPDGRHPACTRPLRRAQRSALRPRPRHALRRQPRRRLPREPRRRVR